MTSSHPFKPRTIAAQALGPVDPQTKAIVPPVHMATTFVRDPDNQYRSGFSYGRPDNATVRQAEAVLAALETAEEATLFSSGMAAASAIVLAFDPPTHIVAPRVMYWGWRSWLTNEARRFGYSVDLVDMSRLEEVARAILPGRTKLVWIETPANPLWSITDVAAVAELAHDAGATVAVDSTAATPILSRPLSLGADLVMHSATKYLNGHSDVLAGAVAAARCDDLWGRIKKIRTGHGAILGPMEAWLLLRGLRTLDLRVRAQSETATLLATWLSHHPAVHTVFYPGLKSHPGHAIAMRQMAGGYGGMLSIGVRGGERGAIATAAAVKLWKRATSLGGVESLIEHRASIEGPGTPCPADLLRLSAGLEDADDLYVDLDRALRATHG